MISVSTHIKTELDTSGLKRIREKFKRLEKSEIKWGFFGGEHSTADMSYAALAYLLELGRPGTSDTNAIPPRPAFRQSIQSLRLSESFDKVLAKALGEYIKSSGQLSPDAFLKASGEYAQEEYQFTMTNWINVGTVYRHNAPMTIDLKGKDQPFVDTGELVQNVSYQIE